MGSGDLVCVDSKDKPWSQMVRFIVHDCGQTVFVISLDLTDNLVEHVFYYLYTCVEAC